MVIILSTETTSINDGLNQVNPRSMLVSADNTISGLVERERKGSGRPRENRGRRVMVEEMACRNGVAVYACFENTSSAADTR